MADVLWRDYKNLSWVRGADRKIRPEGHSSASQGFADWDRTMIPRDRFFYLHWTSMKDSFSCIPLDFQTLNLIIAIVFIPEYVAVWHYVLTSNVVMSQIWQWRQLSNQVNDLLYNQCTDHTWQFSFFSLPMGKDFHATHGFCLCWGLTSQSTIFQSCRDGATASWVINQYFRGVKCLAQGYNTAAVGFEPPTSRSGVRRSPT